MFSPALEIVLTVAYREATLAAAHPPHARAPALRARARPDGERILAACGADLPQLRKDLDKYLEGIGRAVRDAASRRSRSRRSRSAACCRRRCCTCRAPAGRKCSRATCSRPRCSRTSRTRRSCSPRRASRGSTCSNTSRTASARCRRPAPPSDDDATPGDAEAGIGERGTATSRDPLSAYAANLTARARAGELDPLIGRADELQRTMEILCRRRKNNPVFVGDAGVGKTALAEGLATRLLSDDVPELLEGAEVFSLDTGGAARRHALPRRLRRALQGGHPRRSSKRPHADPLHRRDPLDRRRRRDHRRHDGPRDADQADPHRRPAARRRLDDARGVQAHREGSRAGAAAAEDHHRRAVDPGDGQDPRRACARATRRTTA